jgi:hypothetical protein
VRASPALDPTDAERAEARTTRLNILADANMWSGLVGALPALVTSDAERVEVRTALFNVLPTVDHWAVGYLVGALPALVTDADRVEVRTALFDSCSGLGLSEGANSRASQYIQNRSDAAGDGTDGIGSPEYLPAYLADRLPLAQSTPPTPRPASAAACTWPPITRSSRDHATRPPEQTVTQAEGIQLSVSRVSSCGTGRARSDQFAESGCSQWLLARPIEPAALLVGRSRDEPRSRRGSR